MILGSEPRSLLVTVMGFLDSVQFGEGTRPPQGGSLDTQEK